MRKTGALIGLLSGAVSIAVAHVAATFVDEASSPLSAVGSAVIDLAPAPVKEFGISTFGSQDKAALVIGISVLLAVFAAVLGAWSMRRRWIAFAGLAAFGAIGVIAATTRPAAGSLAAVPSIAGAAAGLGSLRLLFNSIEPSTGGPPGAFDRRRFLVSGAALAATAAIAGVGSRFAGAAANRTVTSRARLQIPRAGDVAARGAGLDVPGLSSFYTPNAVFYRVDTALIVPKVQAEDWRLRIHGMVEREIEIGMDDLLARPLIERDITLACVSNEVGGGYIGNARWTGTPIKPILEEAGVREGADQLVSKSADGMTIGTPTAALMDGRDAMLAVAMNGEPLPIRHGFPVRMVVPGLYGYVSATKWVVDWNLTTFDAFDAYWIERGWAQQAPIKTMSRIDTPGAGESKKAGVVPIAGVAWAQHTGIRRVEVRVDDGPWRRATLAADASIDTWRQWVYRWDATPGRHRIQARATDRSGYTQTSDEAPPIPDGATGWHTIEVSIG